MLAAMADDDIAKLTRRLRLTAVTPNTITSWDQLEREIEQIRSQGIAFDREENSLGICAVSVAIRSSIGELAAISIPVPTQRFTETEAELTKVLIAHRDRLQKRLAR